MQLKCRSCGADLHGRDVDFDALRASCRRCGWQIGGREQGAYRQLVPSAAAVLAPIEEMKRPLPPLPHFITVTGDKHRLEVVIREPRRWRFVLFTVLGTVSLLRIPLTRMSSITAWTVFALLSTLFTLLIGAFYGNNRHIMVSRREITVTYAPFPRPSKRIDVAQLEQLWVDEREDRGDVTYRLRARLRGGKEMTLVEQITEPLGVLHLERRIEEMLGIVDKPVAGELRSHQ